MDVVRTRFSSGTRVGVIEPGNPTPPVSCLVKFLQKPALVQAKPTGEERAGIGGIPRDASGLLVTPKNPTSFDSGSFNCFAAQLSQSISGNSHPENGVGSAGISASTTASPSDSVQPKRVRPSRTALRPQKVVLSSVP